MVVLDAGMTNASIETTTRNSFRPWAERLFQVGSGLAVLAIALYAASDWTYGAGIGLRLVGMALALVAGVVLAVWAARRGEIGTRRSGAFALTCGIVGLLAAGASYLIEQAIQHAMSAAVIGPLAILTMVLVTFGVIALVAGVVKRINA